MGVEFRLLLERSNKNKKVVNEKENLAELGFILEQLLFPGNSARKLVRYFNTHRKIHKCTYTNVAFTQEYSKVLIFHGEREVY